ncbi:E3 ubiquitin-protein ligase Topors-like [Numida meleagris]|uniref:E3 ubiquitin-protein ligase Topors-like n=1 Tax=Numida meleagris TaxID=8996 RepID=UPI000B3E0273|nr:E3 ubiquitin-protein ligase Topors-like [Numida meleagris]
MWNNKTRENWSGGVLQCWDCLGIRHLVGMASSAQEDLKQSGSVAVGNARQLQQARPRQAADNQCPICLDIVCHAAHVPTCFHCFCFSCIWQWAAMNAVCPICRQPFDRILCAMQAAGDYEQYMLSPFTQRQRHAARERVWNRSPQRHYNLRLRHSSNRPMVRRRERTAGQQVLQVNTAAAPSSTSVPGTFREPTLPNAVQRPASPVDGHPRNFSMMLLRARLLHFLDLQ